MFKVSVAILKKKKIYYSIQQAEYFDHFNAAELPTNSKTRTSIHVQGHVGSANNS